MQDNIPDKMVLWDCFIGFELRSLTKDCYLGRRKLADSNISQPKAATFAKINDKEEAKDGI